jgi:hypothetical protein
LAELRAIGEDVRMSSAVVDLRAVETLLRELFRDLGGFLRYGLMLLAWKSKFSPRARWSDSSHSREPMGVNATSFFLAAPGG